jgi:hypothetical protein
MTDAHLRQFLLRRLPADEAARLEDAILLEEGIAERLQDEEFDLLDDYAASRLNAGDAADVERYLLGSAQNMHSLRVARALQRQGEPDIKKPKALLGVVDVDGLRDAAIARSPGLVGHRSRTPQIAGVAALLAACLVVVMVIPRWRLVSSRPESVSSTAATATVAASGDTSVSTAGLPIISLLADVSRGMARSSLAINADAGAVRLQAEVPESSTDKIYALHVDDAQGHRLFEGAGLAVHTAGPYRFVEAVVPAAALAPGDRSVSLTESGAPAGAPVTYRWDVTGVVGSQPEK